MHMYSPFMDIHGAYGNHNEGTTKSHAWTSLTTLKCKVEDVARTPEYLLWESAAKPILNSAYGLRRHRFMPHFVEDSSAKWSEFWSHLLLCQKVGVVQLFLQKRSKESHQKLKQDTWWFQENCVTLQNPKKSKSTKRKRHVQGKKTWRNSSKLL